MPLSFTFALNLVRLNNEARRKSHDPNHHLYRLRGGGFYCAVSHGLAGPQFVEVSRGDSAQSFVCASAGSLGQLHARLDRRPLQPDVVELDDGDWNYHPLGLHHWPGRCLCAGSEKNPLVATGNRLFASHHHGANPAVLFPLYFLFAKLGLINNVLAVSLVYTAIYSPFAIMLLRTYFLAVPKEIEEAARVDGATPWQVFSKVMLPIVSPGILTVALIIGLYAWNEFLIATTFLQQEHKLTAVVSFFLLSGQYSSDWGEIMAAALIIILPIVVLFVFLQRHFIEGMAGGSVKG